MPLVPGTRLGPYELTALLGVGGMGEVCQATDTHLKRAVAIKVLPATVAGDADRLARFQREAEVLAALRLSAHPDARLHGVRRRSRATRCCERCCRELTSWTSRWTSRARVSAQVRRAHQAN